MPLQPPPRRRPALHVVMGDDGHLHVGRSGHIRVKVASVHFASCVIDDLAWINTDGAGATVLDACETDATRVLIVRPEAPIDPPNGTVQPFDRAAATASGRPTGELRDGTPLLGTGRGSASRISYEPDEWPWPGDPASTTGAAVLLAMLRQARINAAGADDPADGLACVARAYSEHG